jgi:hypothetical protein
MTYATDFTWLPLFSHEGCATRERRWLLWLTVPLSKARPLITADRGYESYNHFAHMERKGWNYVIRVKDLESNGILSSLHLPSSGEFDIDVHLTLTKKQTQEVKAHPEIYKFVPSTSIFDFLDLQENFFYPISFRVVRFFLPLISRPMSKR